MADTELDVRERAPALAAEPSQPTQRVDRVTVIKPAPRWPHLDVRELWQYRELLGRLAWRDIAVRYKQTSIGVAWAILQPFLTMVVFTFVFGTLRELPLERRAVPDLHLLRAAALDVLRVGGRAREHAASSRTAAS